MTVTRAAPETAPRSTTNRDQRRYRAALLVVAAVVLITSFSSFTGVRSTIGGVAGRTAPAVLEVASTRSALVQADAAAMSSFRTGEGRLIGPGAQYQSELAAANQNLTQVAEHNAAGEEGSQTLQLVEGLLTEYGSLVEEADANFRGSGPTLLSVSDLWYASRLMNQDAGILNQLDALDVLERKALSETLSTAWLNPTGFLLWAVPIAVLLGLLMAAQAFGQRTFQRTVNPALAAATLLALLVAGGTSATLVARSRAQAAERTVDQVVTQQTALSTRIAADGQQDLAQVLRGLCPDTAGCGDSVQTFLKQLGAPGVIGDTDTAQNEQGGSRQVSAELAAADPGGVLGYLLPIGALAIAALVLLGFQRGIDEYRYRST